MIRSRRRRNRRIRNKLVIAASLAALALTTWFCAEVFFTPDVIVRVLYCETANCTPQERMFVAGVMQNRIGNPAFGNLHTFKAVIEQSGAFSCIGDNANTNWRKTRHPGQMTPAEHAVWEKCVACLHGEIPAARGPSGRLLVYYHDKSIGKPASWDNAKWRAIRETSTQHFVFYSIVPAK